MQHRSLRSLQLCGQALVQALRWSPGWFISLVVLNAMLALAPAAQVLAVGWLTRAAAQHTPALPAAVAATAAALGATYLLAGLVDNISQTQRAIQQARFMSELRAVIARLRPSQLADSTTSARIQTARSAVDYTLNGLAANIVHVVAALVTAVSLLATLWRYSPLAACLVVASLAPLMAMYHVLSGYRRAVICTMSDNERASRYFTDQLVYQRPATELASLGTAHRMAAWGDEPTLRNTRIVHRFGWQSIGANAVASLAIMACIGGALAALSIAPNATGATAAGILGIISGIAATRETGAALGQIILALPLMEAYAEVVGMDHPEAALPPIRDIASLDVTGLRVRYPGRDVDTLHHCTLHVERGEMIAIVGVNGAGKTTLVNAILGIIPTAQGQIALDDRDITALTERERTACFGMLTQEFGRYELTIRQSLLLATPEQDVADEQLWAALERAQARAFVEALPHGLDTQLGQQWDGVGISGGQWQRLSLARIYLRDAGIWILDEPTSAVDAQAEAQIFAQLADDKAEHITIAISHRASTLKHADRIYVIDAGAIVQMGSFDDLAHAPGRFRELFAHEFQT